nr:IS66 family transposase [Bradyrhizobium sp. 197]
MVTRRPQYICRRCSGCSRRTHRSTWVPAGLPTEAATAHVIVSKIGDHTPFHRQAEIYARQGIRLDRGHWANWSGRACFHLQPVKDHMRRHLERADRLFMDETTAPVLVPGSGHTKNGYFVRGSSPDIPIAASKTSCRGDSATRQANLVRVAAKRLLAGGSSARPSGTQRKPAAISIGHRD